MLGEPFERRQAVAVKGVRAAKQYAILALERLVANRAPVLNVPALRTQEDEGKKEVVLASGPSGTARDSGGAHRRREGTTHSHGLRVGLQPLILIELGPRGLHQASHLRQGQPVTPANDLRLCLLLLLLRAMSASPASPRPCPLHPGRRHGSQSTRWQCNEACHVVLKSSRVQDRPPLVLPSLPALAVRRVHGVGRGPSSR